MTKNKDKEIISKLDEQLEKEIISNEGESAGAAEITPEPELTPDAEPKDENPVVQKGLTDKVGNWCVTEMIVDGEWKKFEIPEEAKGFKYPYVKHADDSIIVE